MLLRCLTPEDAARPATLSDLPALIQILIGAGEDSYVQDLVDGLQARVRWVITREAREPEDRSDVEAPCRQDDAA